MEPLPFWDPLGDTITESLYAIEQTDLTLKLNKLQAAPWKVTAKLIWWIVACILTLFFIIFLFGMFPNIDGHIFYLLAIPVTLLVGYYKSIKDLQENLLLLMLSQRYHWAYESEDDPSRYDRLALQYPDIFGLGHDSKLTDQVWGTADQQRRGLFWICSFEYVTGSGKSQETHYQSIVAVKLQKSLTINFHLERQGMIKFSGMLSTESQEFNDHFRVRCDNQEADAKNKILMILSPSVIVRLVELIKQYPITLENIYFQSDTIFFVGQGNLWKTRYTNFFREVKIDERDETGFIEIIQAILQVPIEMLRFI